MYIEYIELNRNVTPCDGYDKVCVIRKKICRSNPEESFETIENICFNVDHVKSELSLRDAGKLARAKLNKKVTVPEKKNRSFWEFILSFFIKEK